ncbi:hypothetical protein E2C01_058388 [Portunus trituberculatus]|uniref:Uncharacterized protein n=1 Tax=Portunus trituberculatus TaxID=210409 RepID=A0A5B7H315_PORTR|nr:hypothetical protein [Portunus trituberculatus]
MLLTRGADDNDLDLRAFGPPYSSFVSRKVKVGENRKN